MVMALARPSSKVNDTFALACRFDAAFAVSVGRSMLELLVSIKSALKVAASCRLVIGKEMDRLNMIMCCLPILRLRFVYLYHISINKSTIM